MVLGWRLGSMVPEVFPNLNDSITKWSFEVLMTVCESQVRKIQITL